MVVFLVVVLLLSILDLVFPLIIVGAILQAIGSLIDISKMDS